MSASVLEKQEVQLDRYNDSGFGLISLRTGKSRYWRLSEQSNLPESMAGWPPPAQHDARCAFSPDGRRLYFNSAGLVCFDRVSGRWSTITGEWVMGFAVMPPLEGKIGHR
jgi:hypothetical protein